MRVRKAAGMQKILILLVMTLGVWLLSAVTVRAQEATATTTEQQTASSTAEPRASATEQNDSETTPEQEEATPQQPPQSAALKERKLGDAFRRFQPSEEISADNAVPFPVDI